MSTSFPTAGTVVTALSRSTIKSARLRRHVSLYRYGAEHSV